MDTAPFDTESNQALPRRINVRGSSGVGKSTYSKDLARRLNLTYIELDALHHGPNWSEPTIEEFRTRVRSAMESAPEGWVIDGNYDSKLGDTVIAAADTMVWLDLPLRTTFPRLWRRTMHRIRNDVELKPGATSLPAATRSSCGRSDPISGTGVSGRCDSDMTHALSGSALTLRPVSGWASRGLTSSRAAHRCCIGHRRSGIAWTGFIPSQIGDVLMMHLPTGFRAQTGIIQRIGGAFGDPGCRISGRIAGRRIEDDIQVARIEFQALQRLAPVADRAMPRYDDLQRGDQISQAIEGLRILHRDGPICGKHGGVDVGERISDEGHSRFGDPEAGIALGMPWKMVKFKRESVDPQGSECDRLQSTDQLVIPPHVVGGFFRGDPAQKVLPALRHDASSHWITVPGDIFPKVA